MVWRPATLKRVSRAHSSGVPSLTQSMGCYWLHSYQTSFYSFPCSVWALGKFCFVNMSSSRVSRRVVLYNVFRDVGPMSLGMLGLCLWRPQCQKVEIVHGLYYNCQPHGLLYRCNSSLIHSTSTVRQTKLSLSIKKLALVNHPNSLRILIFF